MGWWLSENNGESSQTSNIGLYLSTDNLIRTTDTQIQTAPLVLSRNDVLTSKRTVVIPPWLVSGQTYYLGAITDLDNAIGGVTGANNSAYHIIRVN